MYRRVNPKWFALGLIPILFACQQQDPNSKISSSPNPPVSPLLAERPGVGWQQIVGVAHFEDKCTIPGGNNTQGKEELPCLKITGGEDLNDTQTFYVTKSLKELNGVTENQHLQMLAQTNPLELEGTSEIAQVDSVAFLYK